MEQIWFWVYFNLSIALLLMVDLFFFHQKGRTIEIKEALFTSLFWIALALLFNLFIFYSRGVEDALNFLTGYLIEKALSVDNLFVFALIFSHFKVPSHLIHKVLFWGVLGAIVMRAFFILSGIALIQKFHWIFYLFGAFLIYTGYKLWTNKEEKLDLEKNFFLKIVSRVIPVSPKYHGDKFFVKQGKFILATPLFITLLAIEFADLIFALDSIPAIIGITTEPFIVYTSNILAILGLRSLYFVLSQALTFFHYLNEGLSFILIFIGMKMLFSDLIQIPIGLSLTIVILALLVAIFASLRYPKDAP